MILLVIDGHQAKFCRLTRELRLEPLVHLFDPQRGVDSEEFVALVVHHLHELSRQDNSVRILGLVTDQDILRSIWQQTAGSWLERSTRLEFYSGGLIDASELALWGVFLQRFESLRPVAPVRVVEPPTPEVRRPRRSSRPGQSRTILGAPVPIADAASASK